jgi:DNA-binding transcriptional regulator YiaG
MIGEAIKKARLEAGLTKAEVARRLGVDWSTVYKWEVNLRTPGTRYLLELMRILPTLKDHLDGEGDGKERAKR